jgi:hypothetical protein
MLVCLLAAASSCAESALTPDTDPPAACTWGGRTDIFHEGSDGAPTPEAALETLHTIHGDVLEGGVPEAALTKTSGANRYEETGTEGQRHTLFRVYVNDVDRIHATVTELDDGTFYVEGFEFCS